MVGKKDETSSIRAPNIDLYKRSATMGIFSIPSRHFDPLFYGFYSDGIINRVMKVIQTEMNYKETLHRPNRTRY